MASIDHVTQITLLTRALREPSGEPSPPHIGQRWPCWGVLKAPSTCYPATVSHAGRRQNPRSHRGDRSDLVCRRRAPGRHNRRGYGSRVRSAPSAHSGSRQNTATGTSRTVWSILCLRRRSVTSPSNRGLNPPRERIGRSLSPRFSLHVEDYGHRNFSPISLCQKLECETRRLLL
jgi:hypothetical protein